MNARQLEEECIQRAILLAPHREPALFTDFLPRAYSILELDTVGEPYREALHFAKLQLGILITLLDDLVDHPKLRDPQKLREFFSRINSQPAPDHAVDPIYNLYLGIKKTAARFPHFKSIEKLFDFDFESLKQAYLYSNLVYECPFASNTFENRRFGSHNMGILLALTLDLMAVPSLEVDELPQTRRLFYEIQEVARMMNVLMSLEREQSEEDLTGELFSRDFPPFMPFAARVDQLRHEKSSKLAALLLVSAKFKNFDCLKLIKRLQKIDQLHDSFEGVL